MILLVLCGSHNITGASSGAEPRFKIGALNIQWLGDPEKRPGDLGAQSAEDNAEYISYSEVKLLALEEISDTDGIGEPYTNATLDQVAENLSTETGSDWRYVLFPKKADGDPDEADEQLTGLLWDGDAATLVGQPWRIPLDSEDHEFDLWERHPHAAHFSFGPNKTDLLLVPLHMKSNRGGHAHTAKQRSIRRRSFRPPASSTKISSSSGGGWSGCNSFRCVSRGTIRRLLWRCSICWKPSTRSIASMSYRSRGLKSGNRCAETDCNSFRGNRALADFDQFFIAMEAQRPQCGFLQDKFFEPFLGKGKVARATLYFLLRYPGEFDATGQAYDEEGIGTLLDWHERSPVDEHEQHRNQAISNCQAIAIRSSIILNGLKWYSVNSNAGGGGLRRLEGLPLFSNKSLRPE